MTRSLFPEKRMACGYFFLERAKRILQICLPGMIALLICVDGVEPKAQEARSDYKVVFFIDKSGSMGEKIPGDERKLWVVEREVLRQAQQYQEDGFAVEIFAFDTQVYKCEVSPDKTELLLDKGRGKRKTPLKYRGYTDVNQALSIAIQHLERAENIVVYLYTDGQDTVSRPKKRFEDIEREYKNFVTEKKRKWGLYYVALGFKPRADFKQKIEKLGGRVIEAAPEQPHQWVDVEGEGTKFFYEGRSVTKKDVIETSVAKIKTHTPPLLGGKKFNIQAQFREGVPGGAFIEVISNKPLVFNQGIHSLKLRVHNPGSLESGIYRFNLKLSCPDQRSLVFLPASEITASLILMLGKSELKTSRYVELGEYLPGSIPQPSSGDIERWKIGIHNDDGAKKLNRRIGIGISADPGVNAYVVQEEKKEQITRLTTGDEGNLKLVIPQMPEQEGTYTLKVDFTGELFEQGKDTIEYRFRVEKGMLKVSPQQMLDFGQILPTRTGNEEIIISSLNRLAEGQKVKVDIEWDTGSKPGKICLFDEASQKADFSVLHACPPKEESLRWQAQISCDDIANYTLRGALVFEAVNASTLKINGAGSFRLPFKADIQSGKVSLHPPEEIEFGVMRPAVVSTARLPIELKVKNKPAENLQLEIFSDWKGRQEEDKIWLVDNEEEADLSGGRKIVTCGARGSSRKFAVKIRRSAAIPKLTEGNIFVRSREGRLLLINGKEEVCLRFRALTELGDLLIKEGGKIAGDCIQLGEVRPKSEHESSFTAELSEELSSEKAKDYGRIYRVRVEPPVEMAKFGTINFKGLDNLPLGAFESPKNVSMRFCAGERLPGGFLTPKKHAFVISLKTNGPFGIRPPSFTYEFTVPSWIQLNQWAIPLFIAFLMGIAGLFWYHNHGPRLYGELHVVGQPTSISLNGRHKVCIGSGTRNLINFSETKGVAGKHARIYAKGSQVYLAHLAGSQYETSVDGVPVTEPVTLFPGSEVRIGNEVLTYQDIEKTEVEDVTAGDWLDGGS